MKTSINKDEAGFKPCSITITFESKRELDALGGLFNSSYITDALEEATESEACSSMYAPLRELGADLAGYSAIQDILRKKLGTKQ